MNREKSASDYALVEASEKKADESKVDEGTSTCIFKAQVVVIGILAAAGALFLIQSGDPPACPVPHNSTLIRCGCAEIFGTSVLMPIYFIILSQLWMVVQTGLIAFAMAVLKRGWQGARTWVQVCGGPSLFVANSIMDCSRVVWIGFLVLHVVHFFVILYFTWRSGMSPHSAFHKVYFDFVNSGAVTFVVFATLGTRAAESLVQSHARLDAFERGQRRAAALLAQYDHNGDGFLDFEEIEDYGDFREQEFKSVAQGWGCDAEKGLDAEGARKLSLFIDRMYDGEAAEELKGKGQGMTALDPADVIICGQDVVDWNETEVLMFRSGDREGLPTWACVHNVVGLKELKSVGGFWQFIKGENETETQDALHGGLAPQDCWPEYVRTACMADLEAMPAFATIKLNIQMKRSLPARMQRSTIVFSTMAALLAPMMLTHVVPAALSYLPIMALALGLSALLLCASVGAGEVYGNLRHSGLWGIKEIEGAGEFGYKIPAALGWLIRPYSILAGWFRARPVFLRLACMNMALAGFGLCVQLCYNYALMHYTGRPYGSAPLAEFQSRRIACVACMKEASSMHSLNTLSWVM